MPTVDQAFQWLTSLPPEALYASVLALAFIENIFPPFPSDVFIGICAFVAVQGDASPPLIYTLVVLGNVIGATVTYTLGRRYGAARLRARLMQKGDLDDERKFEKLYAKYGMLGLFLGRWVPGVRGLVPMAAGALRISAVRTIGIVAIVAMLFYGILIGFAFSVGTNWEAFYAKITAMGKWGTIFGIALALIAVSVFLVVRRRRKASNHIR